MSGQSSKMVAVAVPPDRKGGRTDLHIRVLAVSGHAADTVRTLAGHEPGRLDESKDGEKSPRIGSKNGEIRPLRSWRRFGKSPVAPLPRPSAVETDARLSEVLENIGSCWVFEFLL